LSTLPQKKQGPSKSQSPSTSAISQSRRRKTQKKSRNGLIQSSDHVKLPSKRRNEREEICHRLGIRLEDAASVPEFTNQLKSADGGLPQVLAAIRSSEDPELKSWLGKYDSLSERDRKKIGWEVIAVAAGVKPGNFLGNCLIALQAQQANISAIIAHSNHPKIVQKRVRMALRDEGIRDREALDIAVGFLPSHKGTSIVNRIQVANLSSPETPPTEIEVKDDLPLMENVVTDLHQIRLKALEGMKV
jgi:hypothetical protein